MGERTAPCPPAWLSVSSSSALVAPSEPRLSALALALQSQLSGAGDADGGIPGAAVLAERVGLVARKAASGDGATELGALCV